MDETTANIKKQTDVLRAEIERARYETVQTVSELQRRLSIDNVRSRARESIRDATVGKAQIMTRKATGKTKDWGTSVYKTVRHNPIPMVMVGTGIAWLIRNRGDGRTKEGFRDEGYTPAYDEQTIGEVGDLDYPYARRYYETMGDETLGEYQEEDRQEKLKAKTEEGRAKLQTGAENLRRRATDVTESARDRARQLGEKARESTDRVRSKATDFSQRAQQRSRHAKQSFLEKLDNNPLAVAGVLFAVGTAIGLFAPRSQKERELMGGARDSLVDRAREAGQEQMEKVRSVAHQAKEAAIQEAQRQEIIDPKTAEKAEHKGRSALEGLEEKSRESLDKAQQKIGAAKEEGKSQAKPTFKKT